MDSLAFLTGSLDALTRTLTVSNHSFPILKQRKWRDFVRDIVAEPVSVGSGGEGKGITLRVPLCARRRRAACKEDPNYSLLGAHWNPNTERRVSAIFGSSPTPAEEAWDDPDWQPGADDDADGEEYEDWEATLRASHPWFRPGQQGREELLCRDLLLRKGVFPYSWLTSYAKLAETSEFPSKECFYLDLSEEHISDEDYEHARRVWDSFNCATFEEYSLLYVTLDTWLLAECMMEFRYSMLEDFDLDPFAYFSLPHLVKDVMLSTTGAELELLSDPEMVHMLKDNLRGGVSYIATRYLDKKELRDFYREDYAMAYVDQNNLYGIFFTRNRNVLSLSLSLSLKTPLSFFSQDLL